MLKNQMFIAAALFVGVAIGYFVKSEPAEPTDQPEERGYVGKSEIGDKGLAASNAALKRRIAELEALLAKGGDKGGDAEDDGDRKVDEKLTEEELSARKRDEHGPGARAREMREHMEWLAKEKPAEYAQLTNSLARWRQRRIERANSKLDYLAGVDTSKLSDEQRQVHERYQDLLVRREELEDKLHNPEMSDEDREDIMRDMFRTRHEMGQMANAERDMLIGQTVEQLGFSGSDAEEVRAAFGEILSVTESRGGGFGPPPPGGGAGGGPGGTPPPVQ